MLDGGRPRRSRRPRGSSSGRTGECPVSIRVVREVIDDDEEFVEAMRVLGERAGAEYAYVGVVRARKRG